MDAYGRRRRRLLFIVVAVVVTIVIALIGIGLYGIVRGPDTPRGALVRSHDWPTSTSTPIPAPNTPMTTPFTGAPQPIRPSVDPETFARRVAKALFTWDTVAGYEPVDCAQAIIDAGDPTGAETAGLASDIRGYLPATAVWAQLRQFQTRQWLVIDTALVPPSWADAMLQAAPGRLLPGTTAYTITGARHRSGIWENKTVVTVHPVAFTVFITCAPTFDTCRLLRLSGPDTPLR